MSNNRRKFIKNISIVPLIPTLGMGVLQSCFNNINEPLKQIGRTSIKSPKDIKESPFGIGCETLDRELWDPKEIYPWMNDLSVKWARLQTGWERVERVKGEYDWAWLDESVDGLIERGFKPFFNVGYGNPNYNGGGRGYYPNIDDKALAGWKKFVTALVQRYKDRIQYYEIWNEPNLGAFWRPEKPNPAKYVELVKETVPLIRQNYSDARIVGGVVSRLPFDFIEDMFENGLADNIDVFSFHPYGTKPDDYNEPIKRLKKLIDKYDPKIKIWQGENGYPSEPNSTGYVGEAPWTENVQAKFMLRRLILDCSLGVEMSCWFLIVDIHDYPKGSGRSNFKGILQTKPEIRQKVAFKSLQYLGSVVNGKVASVESIVTARNFEENNETKGFYASVLNVEGGQVLAYWNTVKIADQFEPEKINLTIEKSDMGLFKKPVLVDLLSGEIYDLKNRDSLKDGKTKQVFGNIPCSDYPMLIVEKDMI